jgi:hypothetical protein
MEKALAQQLRLNTNLVKLLLGDACRRRKCSGDSLRYRHTFQYDPSRDMGLADSSHDLSGELVLLEIQTHMAGLEEL